MKHSQKITFILFSFSFLLIFSGYFNLTSISSNTIKKEYWNNITTNHIKSIFNAYKKDEIIRLWDKKKSIKCFVISEESEYTNVIDTTFNEVLSELNIPFKKCQALNSLPPENSLIFLYFDKKSNLNDDENKVHIKTFFPSPYAFTALNDKGSDYLSFSHKDGKILRYSVAKKEPELGKIHNIEIKAHIYLGLLGIFGEYIPDQFSSDSIFGGQESYTSLDIKVLREVFNTPPNTPKNVFIKNLADTLIE